jgi:hypothetical protein
MKLIFLLFNLGLSHKIIKNINNPNKINIRNNVLDSSLNKKNILKINHQSLNTNKITYNSTNICRKDKYKKKIKYFKKNNKLEKYLKKVSYISNNLLLVSFLYQ